MNLKSGHRAALTFFSLVFISIIGYVDYITGYYLSIFILYYIPIAVIAWYIGRRWSLFLSLASSASWMYVECRLEHFYPTTFHLLWNTMLRLVSYVIIALTVNKIRELYEGQKTLASNLQKSLDEIKVLRGMLPICASCKKIRDDSGYWQNLENYIRDHSEADFTHSICPECMEKLYPDIYEKIKGRKKGNESTP
jgi:hypothetical protein